MTTPIVQSISDEQLAELEEYCHKRAFVCCGNFKSGAEYMSAAQRKNGACKTRATSR